MKYTIEYLVNGAREWRSYEMKVLWREEDAVQMFSEACDIYFDRWEAARLVAKGQTGRERKLAEWTAPEMPTAEPSDLGDCFEAQLAEELGLSEEQRERLGHWLKARNEKG